MQKKEACAGDVCFRNAQERVGIFSYKIWTIILHRPHRPPGSLNVHPSQPQFQPACFWKSQSWNLSGNSDLSEPLSPTIFHHILIFSYIYSWNPSTQGCVRHRKWGESKHNIITARRVFTSARLAIRNEASIW